MKQKKRMENIEDITKNPYDKSFMQLRGKYFALSWLKSLFVADNKYFKKQIKIFLPFVDEKDRDEITLLLLNVTTFHNFLLVEKN